MTGTEIVAPNQNRVKVIGKAVNSVASTQLSKGTNLSLTSNQKENFS